MSVPRLRDRLAAIDAPEQAIALLRARQRDGISAHGSLMFYTDARTGTQKSANGLVPVLAAAFWPDPDGRRAAALKQAKKRAKEEAAHRARAAARSGVEYGPGGPGGRKAAAPLKAHGLSGLQHGSRVHAQLEDALLIDADSFENKYGSMTAETRAVIAFVEADGVVPLLGEFPVVDTALGVVARFDLLGVRADGTLVWYELKSGSANCFAAASGAPLAGALAGVLPDSELSRALVQLAFSVFIAVQQHPCITHFEANVLHAVGAHVTQHPVEMPFMLRHAGAMYRDVLALRRGNKA